MATFGSALLDGFDQTNARADGVLRSSQTQADFFKKLGGVEASYSRGLSSLAASTRSAMQGERVSDAQREVGSTRAAWTTILDQLDAVAEAHKALAEALETELHKPIVTFAKDKVKSKKKLATDASKLQKEWKSTQEKLTKTRDTYVAKSKEKDAAEATHARGKEDPTMKPSALAKLAAKSSQLADKASGADSDYVGVLQQTNQKQKEYYTSSMPTILGEWQKWEEDRLRQMNTMLTTFSGLMAKTPPVAQACSDAIADVTSKLSVEEDIRSYCEEQGTGVSVPEDIAYIRYDSEAPSEPTAAASAAGSAAPPKPAKGGSKGSGASGKVGKYQAPGGKAEPFDPSKYPDASSIPELERMLASEEKGLAGLEQLVKFYATDPAAQSTARGELKDAQSKISDIKAHIASLGGGDSGAAGAHDDGGADEDDGGAQDDAGADDGTTGYEDDAGGAEEEDEDAGGGGEDAGEGGEGEESTTLYDYEATCDTELTVKEGETVFITSKDDSGWWYVTNAEGKSGFIPSNYTQLGADEEADA